MVPVRNGWSNRRQFDVQAEVEKIRILVEIDEILLKSSTKFRRISRFNVVSTSKWYRNRMRPFGFPGVVKKWHLSRGNTLKRDFKQEIVGGKLKNFDWISSSTWLRCIEVESMSIRRTASHWGVHLTYKEIHREVGSIFCDRCFSRYVVTY